MDAAPPTVSKKQIRAALSKAGLSKIDGAVLSAALASTLNLRAEQMAECWEAFSLTKNVSELTDHTFQSYRLQLIKDSDATTGIETSMGAVQFRNLKREATNMVTPPAAKRQQPQGSGPSSLDSIAREDASSPRRIIKLPIFEERTRIGEVVASYNSTAFTSTASRKKRVQCIIQQDIQNIRKPYRHMFTAMEERAAVLESQLIDLGNQIVAQYGIGDGENGIAPLEQVNVPRQERVCCVGRICNEAHEGKLNSTSVLIEGSSAACGGSRINVDLSSLHSSKTAYSLFPGQIVAIEGMNPTGRTIVAHRVCEGAAQAPRTTSVKELQKYHFEMQNGLPVRVLTACGPFTTSDNMAYEPFIEFMEVALEQSPDVVILTGPFVDLRQDIVKSGNVKIDVDDEIHQNLPFEAVFANKIAGLIAEAMSTPEMKTTQFVLIPSLDDATAQWVYPQAPLQDRLSEGKDLKILGAAVDEFGSLGLNRINEVIFGVTSTDIIYHMSAEETNLHLEPGTRLRRIAQHMIQQRSFYPLYPPPASTQTNLDLKHRDGFTMPCRPDILIVPSKLTAFASSILDSTVVVNPGHLTKGTTGGTYATMDIHPMKREKLEDAAGNVLLQHGVNDRVNVEVKRI
eukprot:scaffold15514_cov129-Cylindrotheca_fusiformis.AAC.26